MTKFFSIALFFAVHCNAQSLISRDRQIEIGLSVGAAAYLGDVQGNRGVGKSFLKDLNVKNIKSIQGIFFAYYPRFEKSRFCLKIGINNGILHAADSLIVDQGGAEVERKRRNLSFKTNINEIFVSSEFFIGRKRFRPFVSSGIGAVYFQPTAVHNGERLKLRPLMTEAVAYSLVEPFLLVGGGFKFYTKNNKVISLEVMYRQTGTDYLDDVSTVYPDPSILSPLSAALSFRESVPRPYVGMQRGDPKDRDVYFSAVLKYAFLLFQNVKFLRRQSILCPRDVY